MLKEADVVLVLGSSLTVSTVSNFIVRFLMNGIRKELYIANNQPTPFDRYCSQKRYSEDLGKLFEEIKEEVLNSQKLSL